MKKKEKDRLLMKLNVKPSGSFHKLNELNNKNIII